jgi:translation initiation factor 4G
MMSSFNKKSGYVPQGGGQSSRVNVAPVVNSSDSGNNAASTIRNVQNGAAAQPPLHGMLDDFYLLVWK